MAAAFHCGPEERKSALRRRNRLQCRKELADVFPYQFPRIEPQLPVRSFVGEQYPAPCIGREDGCGTTLNQELELLFGVAPEIDFPFDLLHVLTGQPAIARRLIDIQSSSEKRSAREYQTRNAGGCIPRERIERFAQSSTEGSHHSDLPTIETAPDHKHRKEIEEAKGDIYFETPIDERDRRNQCGRTRQYHAPLALKQMKIHSH